MSHAGKKPLQCLQKAINKHISVKLKSDLEYKGRMANVDSYMNVILVDAQEYSKGVLSAQFGKVVIRGNNVLFIKFEDDI